MKKTKRKVNKGNVCEKCYKTLRENQLFCEECGQPTRVLSEDLSARSNRKETWSYYKERKGENYPFAIFFVFVLLIPLFLITHFVTADSYLLTNLFLLLFLPLLFVSFAVPIMEQRTSITIGKYLRSLKYYPRAFLFVLVNLVYFFLLKLITTSVDPILNLVRLIMVLYWLTIILPYAHLLLRKKMNPVKGLKAVYTAGKETRWQHFSTYLYLAAVNLLGLAALGIGLLVTIPYSIAVIERYYLQMDKLGLFEMAEEPDNSETVS